MEGRIKILHVVPLGGVGGAEKFVLSLCRHHDNSRFEVSVCVLFPFTGYSVADEIGSNGHRILKLGMRNGFDLQRAVRLASYIKKNKIEIVNIHGQNPLGKLFSILGSAPVIIHTDHGTTMGSPVKRKERVVCFNRALTGFFDSFIAISRGMEKSLRLRERVPGNKIRLIYNGIDVESISSIHGDKESLKRSLSLPEDIPVLGTVGRLVPEKQYPLLLESLYHLKRDGLRYFAFIAGDGPQRGYLEGLIRSMGLEERVHLLGERADVHELLDIVDVFVFSSGGEAFSITLLEAMAKAKPVVAYDVEGVNEAVETDETGYLVPFGKTDEFSGRIRRLIESPELARQMGQAGFKRVNSHFNIRENIIQLETLYEGLLAGKKYAGKGVYSRT